MLFRTVAASVHDRASPGHERYSSDSVDMLSTEEMRDSGDPRSGGCLLTVSPPQPAHKARDETDISRGTTLSSRGNSLRFRMSIPCFWVIVVGVMFAI
jgi:hypothetical protein